MKIKYLVIFSIIIILVFSLGVSGIITSIPAADEAKGNAKSPDNSPVIDYQWGLIDVGPVRVIAHTDEEVSSALTNGCKVVRDAKTLKALTCSADVASSLGLQEDIRVFAMDSGANTQIKADLVQTGGNVGEGRKVVVLDTGYNYNHPELSSSYLGGKDYVNDDNDPYDDNGHGSHVAGIITADGVDSKSKGVAPGTGIISGKVLSASGSGYFSDVVAAIYWAVDGPDGINGTVDDFNADAISMSLGTSQPYTYKGFCNSVLPDLTNAIKYAIDKGVTVAAAAGNSGKAGVSIPGCISYSTTVGAVNKYDKIASFSGNGNAVDISAPGVSLYSSWLGSDYKTASGTSMATPVVSGTVALIKVAHPGYTVAQVQDALFKTAKDLGKTGKDTSYGYGRVDAYGAVNYAP
ncbi:MAG: S8 family serine peptidase [Nanoarchaeota archaeon]